MRNYTHLLFDLDGTLTDSEEGIINALLYALDKAGIRENDTDKLRSFIGSSLLKTLQQVYDLPKERAEEIASFYRSYYFEKGIYENTVYPGIPKLLSDLKKAGKRLIIATSKRTTGALQVLDIFKLNEYFDLVVGGSADGKISEKADVIRHVFSKTGNETKTNAVMIGDRKYDIIGARENGIDSIAVLYGYATKEEIDEANPTYRVNTVDELRTLLLKNHEGHVE
jgi:phosphoglycolate phosphatase